MTTHPTNVVTVVIPSARLTYVKTDSPAAEPLAQVVALIPESPPSICLSPSSGQPWDLNPQHFHSVWHAGGLTVQVKLRRGFKKDLYKRSWLLARPLEVVARGG